MDRNTARAVSTAALVVLALVLLYLRSREQAQPPPGPPSHPSAADASAHLAMGNPSGATDAAADRNNYLIRKPEYALSYHDGKGTANWVSWRLREGDFSPAPRKDEFHPDEALPRGFHRVRPGDYAGSGFDRGHLCPNGDRMGDPVAAKATFAMTNMIPQAPHCNQKAWADLEEYCRDLVGKKSQTLYIVAGPQGVGGTGSKGPADAIAGGRVTVPAKCWKVVLALENATGTADDATRVGPGARVFAVVMPNDQTVTHGWAKYRTSAREVEQMTGYTFFDRVPAAAIDPLKDRVDDERIPAGRRKD